MNLLLIFIFNVLYLDSPIRMLASLLVLSLKYVRISARSLMSHLTLMYIGYYRTMRRILLFISIFLLLFLCLILFLYFFCFLFIFLYFTFKFYFVYQCT